MGTWSHGDTGDTSDTLPQLRPELHWLARTTDTTQEKYKYHYTNIERNMIKILRCLMLSDACEMI